MQKKEALIEDIRAGKPMVCDGCPELVKRSWEYDGNIHVLALNPGVPCQMGCIYCGVPNARNKISAEMRKAVQEFDAVKILEYLEEHGLLDLWEPIQWSGGEITINPKKREILTCLEKYPVQIFSNCVLYDEQVSRLIAREGSFLNVSLDAGTRETYRVVKGKDVFDQVCATIRRYKAEGAHIEIKYILLPENCSVENIQGFVDFCAEIMPEAIRVSCDFSVDHRNMPREIVDGAVHMANLANDRGVPIHILPYFGEENMAYIQERVK